MTKLEICAIEDANPGQVYLYPEGAFYKAYQKSAWILCTYGMRSLEKGSKNVVKLWPNLVNTKNQALLSF